jgi:hypothetical protein
MIDQKTILTALFFGISLALPATAEPDAPSAAIVSLDISPVAQTGIEQDSNAYRALLDPNAQPAPAPQTQNLLDRTGLDPDVNASATSVGATQRLPVGGQNLIEEQTSIQPYIELGADVEKREDTPILRENDLAADVNASVGGGTTVSVNEQIDLRLGYTRSEPLGSAAITGEAEDKVESGVTIKF